MEAMALGVVAVVLALLVWQAGARRSPATRVASAPRAAKPSPLPPDLGAIASRVATETLRREASDAESVIDMDEGGLRVLASTAVRELSGEDRMHAASAGNFEGEVYARLRYARALIVQQAIGVLLEQAVRSDTAVPPRIAVARTSGEFAELSGDDYYAFKHALLRGQTVANR